MISHRNEIPSTKIGSDRGYNSSMRLYLSHLMGLIWIKEIYYDKNDLFRTRR